MISRLKKKRIYKKSKSDDWLNVAKDESENYFNCLLGAERKREREREGEVSSLGLNKIHVLIGSTASFLSLHYRFLILFFIFFYYLFTCFFFLFFLLSSKFIFFLSLLRSSFQSHFFFFFCCTRMLVSFLGYPSFESHVAPCSTVQQPASSL